MTDAAPATPLPPTPRQLLQNDIVAWLTERAHIFTAPYGILASDPTAFDGMRGKARLITFGIARTLDATLTIWSPKRLELKTNRGDRVFYNVDSFYEHCKEEYGA